MTEPRPLGLRDRWVRVERLLDAPPERVHRAWSDPEELAAWFCRVVEGSLSVGAPSRLVWSDRSVPVDVLESDPPTRFRFRWCLLPDAGVTTEVTAIISRVGYGSRVTVEDGPFQLDEPGAADAYAEAAETWGSALANLRARVDFGVDLRRPVR
jgi:uncharacterized protein YndB with AHSA1/START domain